VTDPTPERMAALEAELLELRSGPGYKAGFDHGAQGRYAIPACFNSKYEDEFELGVQDAIEAGLAENALRRFWSREREEGGDLFAKSGTTRFDEVDG